MARFKFALSTIRLLMNSNRMNLFAEKLVFVTNPCT
jgi:hypothetical protein